MKKHDLPYLSFYPGDWWKDPGIKMLNHEEKGIWFEMLLLMFDAKDRGKLVINDLPMDEEMIARALNLDNQKCKVTLKRLLDFGVASRENGTGIIFSRRMVRDEEISRIRKECGKLGGNPNLIAVLDNQTVNQNLSKREAKGQPNADIDIDTDINTVKPEEIISLYHEILPELPRVGTVTKNGNTKFDWSGDRAAALKARIQESDARQSLDWWKGFFEHVATQDFLMGMVQPRNGEKPFRASLGWILKKSNFTKIKEANYA